MPTDMDAVFWRIPFMMFMQFAGQADAFRPRTPRNGARMIANVISVLHCRNVPHLKASHLDPYARRCFKLTSSGILSFRYSDPATQTLTA